MRALPATTTETAIKVRRSAGMARLNRVIERLNGQPVQQHSGLTVDLANLARAMREQLMAESAGPVDEAG